MIHRLSLPRLVVALMCLAEAVGQAAPPRASWDRIRPAVVQIHAPDPSAPDQGLWGSGVVVGADDARVLIATAAHVARAGPSTKVHVIWWDGRTLLGARARELEAERTDVTLIAIDRATLGEDPVTVAPLAPPDAAPPAGRRVQALGYPAAGSALEIREGVIAGEARFPILIRMEVPEGFSGAPVLFEGQVLGLVSSATPDGMTVVIPSDVFRSHVRQPDSP